VNASLLNYLCAIPLAVVEGESYFAWMLRMLGPSKGASIWITGLAVFVGACLVVARSRRPSVIAAYLVFLPLPLLVGLCRVLGGNLASLAVLSSASVKLSDQQIASGIAGSLAPLYVGLLVIWPSYLVLSVGLMMRTVRSGGDRVEE
jgi:hypothetical protein